MTLIDKRKYNYKMELGDDMPRFRLPATDGKTYSDEDFTKDTFVVVFSCNHCPYVKAAEAAFQKLVGQFGDKADFIAINSNEDENYPEDSFENMKKKSVNYPYLRDETQEVARSFGAECTPHFYVFDRNRELVYQGRMNDAGQRAGSETTHELEDALRELVAGEEVSNPVTAAMGCSIKWR